MSGFFGSGARQTSELDSTRLIVSCSTQPVNSTQSSSSSSTASAASPSSTSPSPMKTACQSLPPRAQLGQRAQRVVDAVLWAHHARVAEQEALAALQRRVGLAGHEAASGRARCARPTTSAGSRRPRSIATCAVGVVDREHDVGAAEGDLLGGERHPVQQAAAEAGQVELRREVVVVEDEAGAAGGAGRARPAAGSRVGCRRGRGRSGRSRASRRASRRMLQSAARYSSA